MFVKRAPPHFVFTVDARNRVAHVVTLLFTIAKREKKSKNKKKKKLTYDTQQIGSWLHGPCFFVKLIYLKTIDIETPKTTH